MEGAKGARERVRVQIYIHIGNGKGFNGREREPKNKRALVGNIIADLRILQTGGLNKELRGSVLHIQSFSKNLTLVVFTTRSVMSRSRSARLARPAWKGGLEDVPGFPASKDIAFKVGRESIPSWHKQGCWENRYLRYVPLVVST
eukprot:5763171-Pyramimonas_sp.AAC.3